MLNMDSTRNGAEKINVKKYNINSHKVYIVFWIIIVFSLCCFVLPWGLYGLACLYKYCIGWNNDAMNAFSGFIGGVIGIFIGFTIENTLIKQFRHLNKYEILLGCLSNTFNSFIVTIEKYFEDQGNIVPKLSKLLLNDIIGSAENDSIFYALPRFTIFGKRGEVHRELHNVNRSFNVLCMKVELYAKSSIELSQVKNSYIELYNAIKNFSMITGMGLECSELNSLTPNKGEDNV